MKLELKHLAPYLPYGLNYFVDYTDGDIALCKVEGLFNDGEIFLADGEETHLEDPDCKPILRPLSDLTKKIDNDKNNITYCGCLKLYTKEDVSYAINMPLGLGYDTLQQLFEWHFDVFGLIENNLAIDINTLE